MKKKFYAVWILLLVVLFGTVAAFGESEEIKISRSWDGNAINIKADSEIKSLYIEFNEDPGPYTVQTADGTKKLSCGEKGFLHEFIELGIVSSDNIKLVFNGIEKLIDIKAVYAFDGTDTPAWVEKWEYPLTEADILVIASHADDEQLFFAGTLPYYTQCTDLKVQVLYATDHNVLTGRQHERLKGLWNVGIRNYPLCFGWSDYYSESAPLAIEGLWEISLTADSAEDFMRSAIEACKPQVIITHDLKGEYGHGMHKLVSRTLLNVLYGTKGFTSAGLPELGSEPAAEAASWLKENDYLKKVYLHLYPERQIVLGFMDQSFEQLGGLTPFQITQRDGFSAHVSQHGTWFKGWLHGKNGQITKASEIKTYNPAHFGLVYSTVGEDIKKDDFFENLKSRAEIQQEEAARRAEEERIEKEKEELRIKEENRLAQELREAKKRKITSIVLVCSAVAVIIIISAVIFSEKRNRGKHGRK